MKKTGRSILFLITLLIGVSSVGQQKKWTLQECVEYAIKNNISIKQSELDKENAEVGRLDAIGNFLPTLNGSGSHSWNIGLNQNITTGLLQNQTTMFTSAGLNSNIRIYNGLQNQNKFRRAKLAIIASQYQLSKMKDDVSLNVANAFLQILFNKESLKVQKEQLAYDEKQLIKIQEMVNVGTVPRGDLLDVKATVASDNQKVVAAENTLFISKLSLAQLLQLDDFQNFDTVDDNYEPQNSPVMVEKAETIVEKAMQNRVELKIARANMDLAERDLKIAKGAFQPSLSGFYSFSTRASYSDRIVGYQQNADNPTSVIGQVEGTGQNVLQPNFSPVLGKPLPFWDQFSQYKGHNFGVQLNIPILNGLSVRNNVQRAKITLERNKNALKQSEQDLERNVYTAITNAKGALNAYDAALAALEARTEAFNYAKEKYAVGMMNSFDFNQSQTLYVNAQSEVLRTKYDYIFKVKIVEFYFGIPISINK
jgi:outer membrane protein